MKYALNMVVKVLNSYFFLQIPNSKHHDVISVSIFFKIYFMYTPLISFVDVVVKITVAFIVSPLKYTPFGLLNSNSHVEGIIIYENYIGKILNFSFSLSFLFLLIEYTTTRLIT